MTQGCGWCTRTHWILNSFTNYGFILLNLYCWLIGCCAAIGSESPKVASVYVKDLIYMSTYAVHILQEWPYISMNSVAVVGQAVCYGSMLQFVNVYIIKSWFNVDTGVMMNRNKLKSTFYFKQLAYNMPMLIQCVNRLKYWHFSININFLRNGIPVNIKNLAVHFAK